MSKLSKLAFLSLILLLSFAGTGKGSHAGLLYGTDCQGVTKEGLSYYFSDNSLNDFGLHSSYEHVPSPGISFPAPDHKNQSTTFRGCSFAIEARLQTFALQYLAYAKKMHLSLEVGDIIFPFHYFW